MLTVVSKALRDVLVADSSIAAVVGTRVYFETIPQAPTYPLLLMDDVTDNTTNQTPVTMLDVQWQVKAIDTGDGAHAQALALEELIRAALHETTLSPSSPWLHQRCQHVSSFSFVEQTEQKQYFHAGGTFRIRMAQA